MFDQIRQVHALEGPRWASAFAAMGVFVLALFASIFGLAPQAWAASPVNVALTVVDATDDTVVFNQKVDGLTDEDTVATLLTKAGFKQVEAYSSQFDYTVSNGAPYFLDKGFDASTGCYWQTLFNGSSNNWADAMIEATDYATGAKSTPTLKDGGHYQYIYGNGSQELAPGNAETYEVTFSYEPHKISDPLAQVQDPFRSSLPEGLAARFAKGGANGEIDNMTFIAAPALAMMNRAGDIDAEAVVSRLDAERQKGSLTSGKLAKYIIMLTAAGKDCTAVRSGGSIRNLVEEMEGLVSVPESVYNAVLILPAYHMGNYAPGSDSLKLEDYKTFVLQSQVDSGLFGGEYPSSQLTAEAILALQPFYATDPTVKAALDKAVAALWPMQSPDGGLRYDASQDYSDVNTTGEAAAALSALGIDPRGLLGTQAANAEGNTPCGALFTLADADSAGYAQQAAQLGYNEPVMAAYALAGLAARQGLAEGGAEGGYLYAARETKPDIAADAVWERIGGKNALDTMSNIVSARFDEQGGTVVLATMGGYWDALTAAGLAGLANAPVLLTNGQTLSQQTEAQLKRLLPAKIIACGGTGAVSEDVLKAAAAAANGAKTARLSGKNAVGTANAVYAKGEAEAGGQWNASKRAFVCTAATFQDALSAAPLAYALHMPIFLANNANAISDETIQAMKDGGIESLYIVGGSAAISAEVEAALNKDFAIAGRFAGKNAIETSELVAQFGLENGMVADKMGVATVYDYYDALAGAAFCGRNNAVLALVSNENSHSIGNFVAQHASGIWEGYVFGGTGAVSEQTKTALADASKAAEG